IESGPIFRRSGGKLRRFDGRIDDQDPRRLIADRIEMAANDLADEPVADIADLGCIFAFEESRVSKLFALASLRALFGRLRMARRIFVRKFLGHEEIAAGLE